MLSKIVLQNRPVRVTRLEQTTKMMASAVAVTFAYSGPALTPNPKPKSSFTSSNASLPLAENLTLIRFAKSTFTMFSKSQDARLSASLQLTTIGRSLDFHIVTIFDTYLGMITPTIIK